MNPTDKLTVLVALIPLMLAAMMFMLVSMQKAGASINRIFITLALSFAGLVLLAGVFLEMHPAFSLLVACALGLSAYGYSRLGQEWQHTERASMMRESVASVPLLGRVLRSFWAWESRLEAERTAKEAERRASNE